MLFKTMRIHSCPFLLFHIKPTLKKPYSRCEFLAIDSKQPQFTNSSGEEMSRPLTLSPARPIPINPPHLPMLDHICATFGRAFRALCKPSLEMQYCLEPCGRRLVGGRLIAFGSPAPGPHSLQFHLRRCRRQKTEGAKCILAMHAKKKLQF